MIKLKMNGRQAMFVTTWDDIMADGYYIKDHKDDVIGLTKLTFEADGKLGLDITWWTGRTTVFDKKDAICAHSWTSKQLAMMEKEGWDDIEWEIIKSPAGEGEAPNSQTQAQDKKRKTLSKADIVKMVYRGMCDIISDYESKLITEQDLTDTQIMKMAETIVSNDIKKLAT